MYVVVHSYRNVWRGSWREVLAGGGCRWVSAAGGVGVLQAWKLLPPLTERQRMTMVRSLSISRLISSTVIFSHSSTSTAFISVTVVTLSEARRRWILLFNSVLIRSIGLKLGELDTHSNFGIPRVVRLGYISFTWSYLNFWNTLLLSFSACILCAMWCCAIFHQNKLWVVL